jgi:crotonobetainyl-CoA:carnitine CoA-transferase CaiB-like acyl-CoA transferase
MRTALQGIRILDLTRVWSGPLAVRILTDLGAEAIRIESRGQRGPAAVPDWQVKRSGFYPNDERGERGWNRNAFINEMNRNKLGVTLELNRPEGVEIFRRLVAISDVVIENYSPRVLGNLGIDYAHLRAMRPDIILVSMPGYGLSGPYRDRVAYGTTLEPEAGLSCLMGYPDRGPQRLGVAYPDPVAGIHAAGAVLLALWHRRCTGEGQHVELAQIESAIAMIGEFVLAYQLTGALPSRLGNRHPWMAPHGCYPCRGEDRWVTIAVRSNSEWQALCDMLGQPWLGADQRFATPLSRWHHQEALDAIIAAWTRERDAFEVMRALQQAGVPAGVVCDGRDLATNPHLAARGFFPRLEHPDAGTHFYPGLPIHLSRTPAAYRTDAPALGQHNRFVLAELLGLTEARVDALASAGIIGDRPLA